jgi:hypothetical protein
MPIIAITTNNSTSVNPSFFLATVQTPQISEMLFNTSPIVEKQPRTNAKVV